MAQEYRWRGDELFGTNSRRSVARLQQDGTLWRVHWSQGEISDLYNRTRAKEHGLRSAYAADRMMDDDKA